MNRKEDNLKRKIYIINLFILLLLFIFNLKLKAENNNMNFAINKDSIEVEDVFEIDISKDGLYVAAGTLWIYFDNDKLECLSSKDNNINIIDNKIIFTWVSDSGRNKNISNLINLKFKAKKEGTASFNIISEIFDENVNKIDIKQLNKEVLISSKTKEKQDTENSKSVNLNIMRLDKEGIIPDFDPNITEYYLTVDNLVEELNVTAIPESSKAKVTIEGNESLKKGINKISITVNNNEKNKIYNINVTKTNDFESANTNLETFAVENYELSPEYQENITEYNIEINNNEEQLNILAIPENMGADVRIENNDKLTEGNNIIEIIVTAGNKITKRVYKLNVYKRNEEEQKIYEENRNKAIEESKKTIEKINDEIEGKYVNKNEIEIKDINDRKELENNIIMWTGIICSVIVLIALIFRIKHEKINKN